MKRISIISFKERQEIIINKDTNPIQIIATHTVGSYDNPTHRFSLCEIRQKFKYPLDDINVNWDDNNSWSIACLSSTNDKRILRKWKRQLSRGRRWF